MELIPNFHWIKGRASNIYLWVSENGALLIDTGLSGDTELILNYIEKVGRKPADISGIFITHADYDHAGGLAAIQKISEAPIFTGRQTAELLAQGRSPDHLPAIIQFVTNRFFKYRQVSKEDIVILEDEDTIPNHEEWQILATPGHSLDHHSFWCQRLGILSTGDAMNTRSNKLKITPKRITADEAAARQSAIRLLRLSPAIFACGHGPPMESHDADIVISLYREIQEADSR